MFHECKAYTISAILQLWEVGGNEQARCYRVFPSNNKLLVHTFYFSLHICGKGGRGVPRKSGLPGVYHLLTDYIGGGGWVENNNLCTNLSTAKKNVTPVEWSLFTCPSVSFHLPWYSAGGHLWQQCRETNVINGAMHVLYQRWSITYTLFCLKGRQITIN